MKARKIASRAAFALTLGGLSVMGVNAQEGTEVAAVVEPAPCANTECVGVSLCDFRSGRWCELKQSPEQTCTNHVC
jgi:hypothetical protein